VLHLGYGGEDGEEQAPGGTAAIDLLTPFRLLNLGSRACRNTPNHGGRVGGEKRAETAVGSGVLLLANTESKKGAKIGRPGS
jgi:hypothetical protein